MQIHANGLMNFDCTHCGIQLNQSDEVYNPVEKRDELNELILLFFLFNMLNLMNLFYLSSSSMTSSASFETVAAATWVKSVNFSIVTIKKQFS